MWTWRDDLFILILVAIIAIIVLRYGAPFPENPIGPATTTTRP